MPGVYNILFQKNAELSDIQVATEDNLKKLSSQNVVRLMQLRAAASLDSTTATSSSHSSKP